MKHYLHTLLLLIFFSPLYAEERNEDITRSASAIQPYSGTFSFSALSPIHIKTDGFALIADSGSLKYDIEINVSKLPCKGGVAMRSNMENVTGKTPLWVQNMHFYAVCHPTNMHFHAVC